MKAVIAFLFVIISIADVRARVLFEGYYRFEDHGKHVGFGVQRDEIDDSIKQRTFTYFTWRQGTPKSAVRVISQSIDVPAGFRPVKYLYYEWGDNNPSVTTGDLGKELTLSKRNLKDGRLIGSQTKAIPANAFFSSQFGTLLASEPARYAKGSGTAIVAFDEEVGQFDSLRVLSLDTKTVAGETITNFQTLEADEQAEMFLFSDGETLGQRTASAKFISYLTSTREEAIGQLNLSEAEEMLKQAFGDVPTGLLNPVAKSRGKLGARETISSFKIPGDKFDLNNKAIALRPMVFATGEKSSGTCRATQQQSKPNHSIQASITFDTNNATTGEPLGLSWSITPFAPGDDRYLIVGLPNSVRFGGDGFIALPANARAPRSIKTSESKTRLIVPLSGALANPNGHADVTFFESGIESLDWTVVELSRESTGACIERSVANGSLELATKFGRPQFVTQNRYSIGDPQVSYISSDGLRKLLVFQDRYQVIDQKTGDLLMDHAGTSPRFSDTGRFVTSYEGSGRLEILDIAAKKIIFVTSPIMQDNFGGVEVAAWTAGDGLLVLGYGRKGAIGVTMPLIDGRNLFTGSNGCNACKAFGYSSLFVDLDQLAIEATSGSRFNSADATMSMVEVADQPSTIKDWDEEKPEERGPPPRRPQFPIKDFDGIGTVADQFELNADEKQSQEHFVWAFSEKVVVAFFKPGRGDAKKQALLLGSKQLKLNVAPKDNFAVDPVRGKVAKRRVEVGGLTVSPKSFLERLQEALGNFQVTLSSNLAGELSRPQNWSSNEEDKRTDAAFVILRKLVDASSVDRAPLIFRKQSTKETKHSTYLAREYASLSACSNDEGPEDSQTQQEDAEDPPIISANRLAALWKVQTSDGALFVAQQAEHCGTSPDLYGDLISVYIPQDKRLPINFKRIAASSSDAGDVGDPAGIDKDRAAIGASLRLTVRPSLIFNYVAGRYLIITSKDSGSAAVFEIPTMKPVQLLEGLPNSLDTALLTLTSDLQTVLQVNNNGALSFFSIASKVRILDGQFIDDEIVLFDNRLNYESTAEGAAYTYVQVPGNNELYTLDQFASRLTKPGVARITLSQKQPPFPAILNLVPPTLSVERRDGTFLIKLSSETGLSVLRVFVDGATASEMAISGKSKDLVLLQTKLPPGKWITFAAEDEQGLRSTFRAFELGISTYPGKLNVLAFGADKFKRARYQERPVNDLGFASKDAKRFEDATKQFAGPSYSSYNGELIDGNSATEDYLIMELGRSAKATQKGDTLVVFFASHGVTDKNGFSLVLPGRVPNADAVILPFTTISNALKLAQGRVFVFLDACHSADATQDVASEQLASNNQDIIVISASKGRQSSLENGSWGGGIFTSAIVDALANSKRKSLGVEEFYAQIRATVISRTNGQQTPWFKRSIWQGPQSIN